MKLQKDPFERIKSGNKSIEIRLFDEKRKNIKIWDDIIFVNVENNSEIFVKVVDLMKYESFQNLLDDFDIQDFGYEKNYDKNLYLNYLYTFYSKVDEKKYGVLWIKIELKCTNK